MMVVQAAKNYLIDYSIATDKNYQDTQFHEALATILQISLEKLERGEDVRLILECPPRHGKSELATKKFTSWVLGKHPDWPIAVASYSGELATKFGQETRDIMESDQYQKIFKTRLRVDQKAKGYWKTGEGGSYFSAGAGGAFTGKGFKIGVVDDIFKDRKEADSKVIRDSRWDWYRSAFYTRQEGVSAIIVINTRWHTDDLVGRLLNQEKEARENGEEYFDKWTRIRFPAIATEDEDFRNKGEALWPDKFPIEKLKITEKALGPYEFSSLYQANPITSENQLFKEYWFKTITMDRVDILNTRKFATIDTGGDDPDTSDRTGIIRNYVDSNNNWYIKAMGVNINSAEIINLLFQLHDEGFEEIGVEETLYTKAIKPFFEIECKKRNSFPNVVELKHGGRNKNLRIKGLIPRYKAGTIFHIVGECDDLIDELIVFPKGANDDVIDALAYQNDIAQPPMGVRKKAEVTARRNQRREEIRRKHGL